MASTRERNGRFTGLYRDQAGAQKSAGTFATRKTAMAKATAAEALEAGGQDAKIVLNGPEMFLPDAKRGHVTVAGYGPQFLADHRLQNTSRDSYSHMLKHVYAGLGTVPVRDLDALKVRQIIGSLEGQML